MAEWGARRMISVSGPGFPVFIVLVAAVWYRLPQNRRWAAMLAASAMFYLALDVPGFFVLLASAWAVWQCAGRMQNTGGSRRWCALGLAAALAPLAFKYAGPLAGLVNAVFGLRLWAGQGLLVPLGLSYFTLQLAGYLLDVRAGKIAPEPCFARLLCYALFFLSITQGPFNRYDRLMPQLDSAPAYSGARVWRGAQRMAWGYFKKLAVAERCAVPVNAAFADPARYDTSQLLFAAVLYSVQLYADFSGYTDIVLGAGEILGLELPENFRQPFLAATVRELWARWHISLSQWLRDYVYIPLGGSRRGNVRRAVNLIVTFLVSGVWHGAGGTFLVWGGLHGILQALENHLPWRRSITKWPARIVGIAGTFGIFVFTFTIFRAESLPAAWRYFACMVQNPGTRVFGSYWELGMTNRLELLLLLLGVTAVAAVDILHECGVHLRDRLDAAPAPLRWAVYQAALFAFLFMGRFLSTGGFLYARF